MAEIVEEVSEEVSEMVAEEVKAKPEIPEKFKGKSLEDAVQMYSELEKVHGRQANELGMTRKEINELRQLNEELLKTRLSQQEKPKDVEIDDVDFIANPKESIRKVIETDPSLAEIRNELANEKRFRALTEFKSRHPDVDSIVTDPEFVDYVKSSPMRTEMYNRANNYDVVAADELMNGFKATRKKLTEAEVKAEKESRERAIKAASVDQGGSGESSTKMYSRKAIINMQLTNPQKYAAMEDEILRAYQEGRVK